MADPGHFQAMLSRYGLFPAPMLPYVSPLIIVGEMLLGLALLSGRQVRHCLVACELLFYTFALAVATVLYRGLQIRCACFGVFSLRVSLWHCLICLAVALYLSWCRHSKRKRAASEEAALFHFKVCRFRRGGDRPSSRG